MSNKKCRWVTAHYYCLIKFIAAGWTFTDNPIDLKQALKDQIRFYGLDCKPKGKLP